MKLADIDSELKKLGLVQSVSVTTASGLSFEGSEAVNSVAIVLFVMASFSRALIGKSADLTWDSMSRFFRSQKKVPGRVRLVFSTSVRRTKIELVAEYDSWATASSDTKNHRYYLALASGFAKAKLPAPRDTVDLLDLLPDEFTTRPNALRLGRASD